MPPFTPNTKANPQSAPTSKATHNGIASPLKKRPARHLDERAHARRPCRDQRRRSFRPHIAAAIVPATTNISGIATLMTAVTFS